ncbi:hypothetical protein [Nostoc sp.]|uniref:hypothetical protein n=1 Tax=Nostoc sp. TaxID=1180 RepID=UPI002FFC5F62
MPTDYPSCSPPLKPHHHGHIPKAKSYRRRIQQFLRQNPEWILCDWMENRGLEQAILRRSFAFGVSLWEKTRFPRRYREEEKILSLLKPLI